MRSRLGLSSYAYYWAAQPDRSAPENVLTPYRIGGVSSLFRHFLLVQ